MKKHNFLTRVLVVIGSLAVALIGVGMALLGLQFKVIDFQSTLPLRLLLIALGLFLIIYAVFILLLPRKLRKTQENFMVQQTANGELRISMKAIESIVKKCVENTHDVSLVNLDVNHSRGTVRVDLKVSMPGNVSIPLAAENLQKQIVKQIQAAAGIDAAEVRISVETSENQGQTSPYLLDNLHESAEALPQGAQKDTAPVAVHDMAMEAPSTTEGTEENEEQ